MPCTVEDIPVAFQNYIQNPGRYRNSEPFHLTGVGQDDLKKIANTLHEQSVELDHLRELVIDLGKGSVDPQYKPLIGEVEARQIKHRQEDLTRIAIELGRRAGNGDKSAIPMLTKVAEATAARPLKPQLGFDPDSI